MKFLKKNFIYLLLTALLVSVLVFKDFRAWIGSQILMKPSLDKVSESVTLSKEETAIQLKGINTPDILLSDLQGKPIFLNFWGTWCPPCRAEFPSIEKLYQSKGSKIKFVLIAMQDEEETVRKFLQDKGYTVPVYIAESPIPAKLLPSVFPTTYILNPQFRILKKDQSAADWNSESVHQFLDTAFP